MKRKLKGNKHGRTFWRESTLQFVSNDRSTSDRTALSQTGAVTVFWGFDTGNSTFFSNKGETVIIYHLKEYAGVKSTCYSVDTCFKERHTNPDHIKRFH